MELQITLLIHMVIVQWLKAHISVDVFTPLTCVPARQLLFLFFSATSELNCVEFVVLWSVVFRRYAYETKYWYECWMICTIEIRVEKSSCNINDIKETSCIVIGDKTSWIETTIRRATKRRTKFKDRGKRWRLRVCNRKTCCIYPQLRCWEHALVRFAGWGSTDEMDALINTLAAAMSNVVLDLVEYCFGVPIWPEGQGSFTET